MSTTLFIYTGAADLTCAAVTSASDLTALADSPMFTLGDSEPLTLKFLSAASTYEAWSGAANYSVAVSLGLLTSDGTSDYSTATAFSPVADGWSGRISLATTDLQQAVDAALSASGNGRTRGGWFYLHIRVTDPSGNLETFAIIRVFVLARVFTTGSTPDVSADTYLTAAQILGAYVQNRTEITSLTGGGAAALDGIATASGAQPTGAIVMLSYNQVGQWWKLLAGTDAEAPTNGVVRPDDYNASTNARVWKQL